MRLKIFLKEPLVAFLLVGLLIFVAEDLYRDSGFDTRYTIEVTPGQRKKIADQWLGQMGREPTPAEIQGLINQWVQEEIYYREALAMGLDQGDTIIRRRLAQKLAFLSEDLADAAPIEEESLRAYYEDHTTDYIEPERFSFEHRYFSSDRRTDAKADAAAALLDQTIAADPFMLQKSYANRTTREIGDLFGRTFAEEVSNLTATELNQWRGPIASAYGWHLVQLNQRKPQRQLEFAEVASRITMDVQQQRRRQANEQLLKQLSDRYTIIDQQAE